MEEKKTGVGCAETEWGSCPVGCPPLMAKAVYELLAVGSPRLAYAVAMGAPLVPYDISLQANFSATSVTLVADVGQQEKIVQDMVVYEATYQIQNQNTPAGFDSLTNYFFELESGIECRLKTIGAGGGYNPIPVFTPLKNVVRRFNKGWLLTYTNGIVMDFQASVALPFPVIVTVTLRSETVYWPRLIDMTTVEALKKLDAAGYCVSSYLNYCQ